MNQKYRSLLQLDILLEDFYDIFIIYNYYKYIDRNLKRQYTF